MNDLYIPFNKKDEVKKLGHNIKFNFETKLWQFEGDLPDDLKKYKMKKLTFPYDMKDYFKEKYSIKWDGVEKLWLCSTEDYVKIMKEL